MKSHSPHSPELWDMQTSPNLMPLSRRIIGTCRLVSSPLKIEYAKSLEFLYRRLTSTTMPARHDFAKIRSECTLACLGRIKINSTEWCSWKRPILRGCGSTTVTTPDVTSVAL